MVDITILELHFDDATFTANTPFGGSSAAEEADTAAENAERDGGGRGNAAATLLGVLVLLALAVALRRFLAAESAAETETERPAVEAE